MLRTDSIDGEPIVRRASLPVLSNAEGPVLSNAEGAARYAGR
ncbi:MAG: hypothetical protein O7D96_08120 [SAR324 cluster bacterium]|nr:hypothetical protein [SAR324 cluster bacterium]